MSQKSKADNHIGWIDYARGIAIFSVVLLHVNGGIISNAIPTPELAAYAGFAWETYSLRLMPIFFLISGAFAVQSLEKGIGGFLQSRVYRVLYPYVLWTFITLLVGTVMVNYTNYGLTLSNSLQIFYEPILHYWFLYALFVISLVYALFWKLKLHALVFLIFAAIIYTFGEASSLERTNYILGQLGQFTIYFVAGALLGQKALHAVTEISSPRLAIIAALSLGFFAAVFALNTNFDYVYVWRSLTGPILVIGVIALSELLDRYKLMRFVQQWGLFSLEIYLVHVLVLAAVRVVLLKLLDINDWTLHFVIGSLAAIYVPIIIVLICRKIGFRYLFDWPAKPAAKTPAQAPNSELAPDSKA